MDHLRETATAAARLYTRAERPALRETCGDLLRAVTQADRAISEGAPNTAERMHSVRQLVVAAAGGAWIREHGAEAALQAAGEGSIVSTAQAATFDGQCAATLRARFPEIVASAP